MRDAIELVKDLLRFHKEGNSVHLSKDEVGTILITLQQLSLEATGLQEERDALLADAQRYWYLRAEATDDETLDECVEMPGAIGPVFVGGDYLDEQGEPSTAVYATGETGAYLDDAVDKAMVLYPRETKQASDLFDMEKEQAIRLAEME